MDHQAVLVLGFIFAAVIFLIGISIQTAIIKSAINNSELNENVKKLIEQLKQYNNEKKSDDKLSD